MKVESLGDAARRLLAGLEQDAKTNGEKASGKPKNSPEELDQPGNVVPFPQAEKCGVSKRIRRSAALDETPQATVAAWEELGGNGLGARQIAYGFDGSLTVGGGRVYSLFEYSRNTRPGPDETAMGRSRSALRVWDW